MKGCGLVGGTVSWGVSFEVSIPMAGPVSLPVGKSVYSSQLLFQHHACLYAAMLSAMIIMSQTSETVS